MINDKDLTIITNVILDPGVCTSNPGISVSRRTLPSLSCTHHGSMGHTAGSSPGQWGTIEPWQYSIKINPPHWLTPVTERHWEESGSAFFTASFQMLVHIDMIPWTFSRLNTPSSFTISMYETCYSPSVTFVALHWISSRKSLSFLYPDLVTAPTWTQHSWCLTSAEYWSRITFLDLLAMLLLMQPRTPSAFFAARAHCCLMISLVSIRTFPSKLPSS